MLLFEDEKDVLRDFYTYISSSCGHIPVHGKKGGGEI